MHAQFLVTGAALPRYTPVQGVTAVATQPLAARRNTSSIPNESVPAEKFDRKHRIEPFPPLPYHPLINSSEVK
jgi:hypothetical protein